MGCSEADDGPAQGDGDAVATAGQADEQAEDEEDEDAQVGSHRRRTVCQIQRF